MNDILANYDEERIAEFGDEGDPRPISTAPFCNQPRCDEPVAAWGDSCALCQADEAALVDEAAMALLCRQALSVEISCALYAIERAIRHIARGRYRLPKVTSRVIDVLTEAA